MSAETADTQHSNSNLRSTQLSWPAAALNQLRQRKFSPFPNHQVAPMNNNKHDCQLTTKKLGK